MILMSISSISSSSKGNSSMLKTLSDLTHDCVSWHQASSVEFMVKV